MNVYRNDDKKKTPKRPRGLKYKKRDIQKPKNINTRTFLVEEESAIKEFLKENNGKPIGNPT